MRTFEVERSRRQLSLALWPIDVVTGRGGEAQLDVRIEPRGPRAIRSLSGYYAFEDLAPRRYVVRARAVGTDSGRYLDQRIELDIDEPPLVTELELLPAPAYPFRTDATLVRGRVLDGSRKPLEGAQITFPSLGAGAPHGESDATGAFVVAFDDSIGRTHLVMRVEFGEVFLAGPIAVNAHETTNTHDIVLGFG